VGLADRSGHRAELGRAGRRVPERMADHVRPLVAVQLREHLRPGERALGEAILRTQRWDGQWQRDLRGKVRRDCVRRRSGGAWRCWRGTRVNASNLFHVRPSPHRPKRKWSFDLALHDHVCTRCAGGWGRRGCAGGGQGVWLWRWARAVRPAPGSRKAPAAAGQTTGKDEREGCCGSDDSLLP
jgi:hypothetical protein